MPFVKLYGNEARASRQLEYHRVGIGRRYRDPLPAALQRRLGIRVLDQVDR